jgi:hypothetical protein
MRALLHSFFLLKSQRNREKREAAEYEEGPRERALEKKRCELNVEGPSVYSKIKG